MSMHIILLGNQMDDGRYYFRISDGYGNYAYRTNKDGEGLWRLNESTGEWKQLTGTAQFHLHQRTDSGKRQAIRRLLEDGNETSHVYDNRWYP